MPSIDTTKLTKVDDLLSNAASALAIANDFGALLPIPLVCTLIGAAQVIIQTAQVSLSRIPSRFLWPFFCLSLTLTRAFAKVEQAVQSWQVE